MKIDPKRLEEVKRAALAAAPEADLAECAAALLVIVFDPAIREHVKRTQVRLWGQILHALGPIRAEVDTGAPEVEAKPKGKGKPARDAAGRCVRCKGLGAVDADEGPAVRCPACKGLGTINVVEDGGGI